MLICIPDPRNSQILLHDMWPTTLDDRTWLSRGSHSCFVIRRPRYYFRIETVCPENSVTAPAIGRELVLLHSFPCTILLLGAFAKLRDATISFVMSVRPPGTTRLHWTVFHEIWYLVYFENLLRNSCFIKIWQELRVLYLKTNVRFLSYLSPFF